MKKILFISTRYPFPIFGGDKLRAFDVLKFLSKKNQVNLVCLGNEHIAKNQELAFCESIKVFNLNIIITRMFTYINPRRNNLFQSAFAMQILKIKKNKNYTLKHGNLNSIRTSLSLGDAMNAYWLTAKKGKVGEIYNIGGGRKSNCSVNEAINYVELLAEIKVKKIYRRTNRIGDHIWYISDTKKFRQHYPNWKQKYDTKKIIEELIYNLK